MPRKQRFFLPGIPVHVVQRGNNRQSVFFEDNDYRVYLNWLSQAARDYGCQIHAYVLMTNHTHLLMTPADGKALSATLQALGRRFVPYINLTYRRTGTLWEGRFKASLIQEDTYLLACHRYIELNPVRAHMVSNPRDYPWSSYRANALGEDDTLLSPHPLYLGLGEEDVHRQAAYQNLFQTDLDPGTLLDVRACLQTGTPLGNHRFRDQVERALGVKVGYAARGRPKKRLAEPALDEDQMSREPQKRY